MPELEDVEEAEFLPYHNQIFIIKVISSINSSCKNQYPDEAQSVTIDIRVSNEIVVKSIRNRQQRQQ